VDWAVDDHIDILRKKLTVFFDDFRLDSMRGRGYRLTIEHPRVDQPDST
jgi:DNA-binding response OmpR family regulator